MSIDPGPFRLGDVGGTGPAVLCVHGLTGTPYEVRPPAELLARHGFACLGLLLPGHGQTPQVLARTPRARWLGAVLSAHAELALTHKHVYLLGLSLGGVLSLAVAARRSVAGAVLMATPLELGWWVRWLLPLLEPLVRSVPKSPAIRDREARARHPGYRRMPLAAVREMIRLQREVGAQLARVTTPLHLIYSRRDPMVRVSDAERILCGVSSARRQVHYLSRSAHVVTVDLEGREVACQALEFLSELEAQAAG